MMKSNQEKYIEHVQIDRFWGRYDVDWQLNSDVNILVGENGTGKSSLLLLLNLVLNAAKAGFSDKFMASDSIKIYENNQTKIFDGKVSLGTFGGLQSQTGYFLQGKMSSTLNVNYLSTFDMNIIVKSDSKDNDPQVKTSLDFILKKTLEEFSAYELRQTRKAARHEMTFTQALEKKNYLVSTINRLFKSTEKRVDDEQGDFAFRLNNGEKLSIYDLSAGEKQLLLTLLTVIIQEEQPSVLLLDEPEISLHILWQHELIDVIRLLNPHCQIIMATHSLSLFTKKWRDKVSFMIGGQNGEKGILKPVQNPVLT